MKIFKKDGSEVELLETSVLANIFTFNHSEWNQLGMNDDLNSFYTGKYYASRDDIIFSLINKPADFDITIGDEIYLIVIGSLGDNFMQILIGGGGKGNAIWLRRCGYGAFNSWTRL